MYGSTKNSEENLWCRIRYIAAVKWATKNLRKMPLISHFGWGDLNVG